MFPEELLMTFEQAKPKQKAGFGNKFADYNDKLAKLRNYKRKLLLKTSDVKPKANKIEQVKKQEQENSD